MEEQLKNIVPDLKLCKHIPEGEFADSALVWERNIGLDRTEYEPVVNTRKAALDHNIICPAPTLEEVLKKLPLAICRQYFDDGDWCVELNHVVVCEPCAASAALQLWLARQKPKLLNKDKAMKKFTFIELLVIISSILIIVAMLSPAFHSCNAKRVNDIRESYITQDADVRVNSYEWFYDMYHQIQATKRKAELAKGTPEERGIRMVLSGMIEEYNAKSRMTGTKAQWKPRDLPFEITE